MGGVCSCGGDPQAVEGGDRAQQSTQVEEVPREAQLHQHAQHVCLRPCYIVRSTIGTGITLPTPPLYPAAAPSASARSRGRAVSPCSCHAHARRPRADPPLVELLQISGREVELGVGEHGGGDMDAEEGAGVEFDGGVGGVHVRRHRRRVRARLDEEEEGREAGGLKYGI